MESTICQQCDYEQDEVNSFCVKCGSKLNCDICGKKVAKDARFCGGCGNSLLREEIGQNKNTFKLRETKDERTLDASFSDVVGKEFAVIINDVYTSRVKGIPIDSKNLSKDSATENTSDKGDSNHDQNAVSDDVADQETNLHIEYPTLIAIAMKNLPATEVEWLVIYSFYASGFGQNVFTREDIINGYKAANKFTKITTSTLARNIQRAVAGNYINPLAEGFSILSTGIEKAQEILSRNGSAAPKTKRTQTTHSKEANVSVTVKSKKGSSNSKHPKKLNNINFYPANNESLKEFCAKFSPSSNSEKNLLFVHYLATVLSIDIITQDHLYTCYDEMNYKIPENMEASINNAKNRDGFLESNDNSGLSLTVKGKNKLKFWNDKN